MNCPPPPKSPLASFWVHGCFSSCLLSFSFLPDFTCIKMGTSILYMIFSGNSRSDFGPSYSSEASGVELRKKEKIHFTFIKICRRPGLVFSFCVSQNPNQVCVPRLHSIKVEYKPLLSVSQERENDGLDF